MSARITILFTTRASKTNASGLPLIYIAVSIYLSYTGLELSTLYLVGALVFAVIGLPFVISVNRNMGNWFMDLEAIN
jgi:hypothetical protein